MKILHIKGNTSDEIQDMLIPAHQILCVNRNKEACYIVIQQNRNYYSFVNEISFLQINERLTFDRSDYLKIASFLLDSKINVSLTLKLALLPPPLDKTP